MPRLLEALPKITIEVKARGIPEGRKSGENIGSRIDSNVVRKSTTKALPKPHINIIWSIESNGDVLKPTIKYKGIEKSNIPDKIMKILREVKIPEQLKKEFYDL